MSSLDEVVHDAEHIAVDEIELYSNLILKLPHVLAHDNISIVCEPEFVRAMERSNAARIVNVPAVKLIKYPARTMIDVFSDFFVTSNNLVVKDYISPWIPLPELISRGLLFSNSNIRTIAEPCILACRYGEETWGHWFLEIFPKIVLAEQFFPGKFRYAVPEWIIKHTESRSYSTSVLEAMYAYDIDPGRLIPLNKDGVYKFLNLFDIVNIRSSRVFHPCVLQALRSQLKISVPASKKQAFAALRPADESRSPHTSSKYLEFIQSCGISMVDLRTVSFFDQVRMAMRGELIVNSAGSGLTSLVFSPLGSRLMILSPANWYDDYFINILQQLNTSYVDIRGKSAASKKEAICYAPYFVEPDHFHDGLKSVLGV